MLTNSAKLQRRVRTSYSDTANGREVTSPKRARLCEPRCKKLKVATTMLDCLSFTIARPILGAGAGGATRRHVCTHRAAVCRTYVEQRDGANGRDGQSGLLTRCARECRAAATSPREMSFVTARLEAARCVRRILCFPGAVQRNHRAGSGREESVRQNVRRTQSLADGRGRELLQLRGH